MKNFLLVSIISIGCCACIQASELNEEPLFSVGVALGNSEHRHSMDFGYSERGAEKSYAIDFDYLVNRHIGVGIGYIDFGEALLARHSTIAMVNDQRYLGETLTYNDGNGFTASFLLSSGDWLGDIQAFVRAGFIDWRLSRKEAADLFNSSNDSHRFTSDRKFDGLDSFVGLGFSYRLNSNLSFSLSHEQFDMNIQGTVFVLSDSEIVRAANEKVALDVTAVELSYRF